MSEDQHMLEAIRLATENVRTGAGGPFGCVIVKEGRVISRGTNLVTSTNDPTAHAEVVAIRRACEALKSFQLAGCDVFTSCEPCPMCLGALYWARPARIFFSATYKDAAAAGFDDAFIYKQFPLKPSERSIPTSQLLGSEGTAPFKAWKDSVNKIAD